MKLFPSLITADLLNLKSVIKSLDPFVQGYHLDIMDNYFVPNLTWGPAFINAIAQATKRQLWVHLMVDRPETWLDVLELPAESIFSFHIEAQKSPDQTIRAIGQKKWVASLAINPSTDLTAIQPYLEIIPHILLMSVKPGFSGQPFIESSIDRLKKLSEWRTEKQLSFIIGIDGGITEKNIHKLIQNGAEDLAIASAIFNTPDPVLAVQQLQNQCK